jgi:hypothetical protein
MTVKGALSGSETGPSSYCLLVANNLLRYETACSIIYRCGLLLRATMGCPVASRVNAVVKVMVMCLSST